MGNRPKLLIAEDDPALVDTMRQVLEEDFSVETAADGSEALDKARRSPPDVVMVDAQMPKLDGYQTCRALRGAPETADVPIIMVTGRTARDDASHAFAAGATDYLAKPFSISQLRARARMLLMRRATSS